VEVGVGGEPWKWQVFALVEIDTARRSHLRPIWALNITNSSQFDGQAFWPVVWQFPARWVLIHSHHCHLKTTRALKHVRQVQESNTRKSRPGKQWQWYTHGLLAHWFRNRVVVKSQPCHCVCGSQLLSNPVINILEKIQRRAARWVTGCYNKYSSASHVILTWMAYFSPASKIITIELIS